MTRVRCAGKAWAVRTRQQTLQTYQGWTLPLHPPPLHLPLRAQQATTRLQITCKTKHSAPIHLVSPLTLVRHRLSVSPVDGDLLTSAVPFPSLRWRNFATIGFFLKKALDPDQVRSRVALLAYQDSGPREQLGLCWASCLVGQKPNGGFHDSSCVAQGKTEIQSWKKSSHEDKTSVISL